MTTKPKASRKRNSVPTLVKALRINKKDVAAWTGMSEKMVDVWKSGAYQPKNGERDRLIAHVRDHANKLLVLADAVESEGNAQEA